MRVNSALIAIVSASLLFGTQPAGAAEITTEGRGCWTGKIKYLGTSKKDFGFTWTLTGVYVDKIDAKENTSYLCRGMGGVVGGKPRSHSWYCKFDYADGSSTLAAGGAKPDGTTSGMILAGTGRHAGATGSWTGGKLMRMGKPPKGHFAACRNFKGKKTLK